MNSRRLEKILFWVIRIGIYALPFVLLVVSKDAFFPFITTKNFLFRGIVEIVAAAWIGLLIINFRQYWPKKSLVFIAFSALIGAAFLATIFSVDPSYSFWSNFERMEGMISYIHLFLLFLALAGTFHRRKDWFALFGVSIVVSVIMASYGLLEYFGVINTFADSSRIIATLGNPLYVAAYLTFHVFLLAFLFFYTKNKHLRILFACLILFELIAFFLTGSRGAFLGIVGGLGAMLFLSLFLTREKKKKIIIAAILLAVVLLPLGLHFLQDISFIKNNDVLSRFSNISITDTTASSRFFIWNMAITSFLERPLLGWGLNNFIVPFAKNYDPRMFGNEPWFDRTHSMPFEWLVSTGIVGFGAYVFLVATIFFSLWKAVRKEILRSRDALILFGMVVTYLFQMLFVFDVLATHLMLVFILGFLAVTVTVPKDTWERKTRRVAGRTISAGHVTGIAFVCILAFVFLYMTNIKPHRASTALIDLFRAISEGKNGEVLGHFDRALALSEGTIGQSEVREQLGRISSEGIAGKPELIQNPEIQAIVERAKVELEKEVATYNETYPNVRFSLMLGRLYGVLGAVTGNVALVEDSLEIYQGALLFAPGYIPLYAHATDFYVQLRRYDEALDLVREAEKKLMAKGKFEPEISYLLPLINVIAGRYDDAFLEMRKLQIQVGGSLLSLDPERRNAVLAIALASNSEEGKKFIEDIYNLEHGLTEAGFMLANIYAEEGRYADARRIVEEVLRANPNHPDRESLESDIGKFLESLDALESL
ncbi:MAG: O-antigen ligase family protein [bacterium]|nr:O-antigen ligase family protein [bacterium]